MTKNRFSWNIDDSGVNVEVVNRTEGGRWNMIIEYEVVRKRLFDDKRSFQEIYGLH